MASRDLHGIVKIPACPPSGRAGMGMGMGMVHMQRNYRPVSCPQSRTGSAESLGPLEAASVAATEADSGEAGEAVPGGARAKNIY